MARTTTEIINDMDTPPSGLSFSELADWVQWRNIFARAIHFFEGLLDRHYINVEDIISKKQYGTQQWYRDIVLQYQDGDSLEVSGDGVLQYPVIDESSRIISICSVEEGIVNETYSIPGVLLKVAKKNSTGGLEPLTDNEKSRLEMYIEKMKPVGIQTTTISDTADDINIDIDVYYKKSMAIDEVIANVQSTLVDFRDNIDFNGFVSISNLYRILDSCSGVSDVKVNTFEWKKSTDETYTEIVVQQLYAGYFNFNSISLNFIAEGESSTDQTVTEL